GRTWRTTGRRSANVRHRHSTRRVSWPAPAWPPPRSSRRWSQPSTDTVRAGVVTGPFGASHGGRTMNPTTISMLGHEHEADLAREARRAALAELARHAPASGKPAVNLSPTFPARRLVVI